MLKRYFQIDVRLILAIMILVELAYNLILNRFVLTDQFFYDSFIHELTIEQIQEATNMARSFSWTVFLWTPVNILLQIVFIAICINVGALLLRYNISFKAIFGVVAKSFIVFVISKVIMIAVFIIRGLQSVEDLNYMPRLSLYDVVNSSALPEWAIYPLQIINLVVLAFILLTAFGLNQIDKRGIQRWIPFVLGTYGTGLAIWAIFVVFFVFL
ncbi:MAG: hypothetical protein IPJ74_16980 [Saprospiraceae bacterium]|nr:hypothetical protein [Saprospiraceae bacterium]